MFLLKKQSDLIGYLVIQTLQEVIYGFRWIKNFISHFSF